MLRIAVIPADGVGREVAPDIAGHGLANPTRPG